MNIRYYNTFVPFSLEKLTQTLTLLTYNLDTEYVHIDEIAQKVHDGSYDGITVDEIINLASETAAAMTMVHPDYAMLAGRIEMYRLHRDTKASYSDTAKDMYEYVEPLTGEPAQLLADDVYKVIEDNAELIDAAIDYTRDYEYDYFAVRTLEKSYLLKLYGKIVERPQHMLMRVALGIHKKDIDAAIETYNMMSQKLFTHATPTLFNAGTTKPQMSSCFLVAMKDDSLEGIFETLKECALISKSGAGIGLHMHNIRANGSYIKGSNGISNGIVPMLRVFNDTARYVDQGGGKRKGSFAMYLEPWHAEIFDFLDLKKNHGKEEMRARDLFYALWISDLFMERVRDDKEWSLFCPNEAKGLSDVWGDEFKALYEQYEAEGKARKTIRAQELWMAILESQIETGTPYMVYKDSANRKSNQQNLGTIKSSNLCTEIMEYTSPEETAVCNLASIALPLFITPENEFDFAKLQEVTKVAARNLNKIIDENYYPVESARRSNMRHRPIGVGVQGLADIFILLGMPFDSPEAKQLNKDIFEAMYYAAMEASIELAEKDGPYESFVGSPLSEGRFQFDLWNVTPSDRWDWDGLRARVMKSGARNSLLLAPMPTATTSQIIGNNECFEPYTSNLYKRRTLSGEYVIVNKHLVRDLIKIGLWDSAMKDRVITEDGSIQRIEEIPEEIRALYKTAWELKQKVIIDMAADRGAFICQSQSLNLFVESPNFAKLTSMHFYGWEKGLKTGMYYLRTKAATEAFKFTVERTAMTKEDPKIEAQAEIACSLTNKDECVACGS